MTWPPAKCWSILLLQCAYLCLTFSNFSFTSVVVLQMIRLKTHLGLDIDRTGQLSWLLSCKEACPPGCSDHHPHWSLWSCWLYPSSHSISQIISTHLSFSKSTCDDFNTPCIQVCHGPITCSTSSYKINYKGCYSCLLCYTCAGSDTSCPLSVRYCAGERVPSSGL